MTDQTIAFRAGILRRRTSILMFRRHAVKPNTPAIGDAIEWHFHEDPDTAIWPGIYAGEATISLGGPVIHITEETLARVLSHYGKTEAQFTADDGDYPDSPEHTVGDEMFEPTPFIGNPFTRVGDGLISLLGYVVDIAR